MINNKFNLEERTLRYSQEIIRFYKIVPKNAVTLPLISQGIRAGTSPGANYREANEGMSKKDFVHKIIICLKEVKESKYWLVLTLEAWQEGDKEAEWLLGKSDELKLIFSRIVESCKKKITNLPIHRLTLPTNK